MPKATNGELKKRIKKVYELILSATPRQDILQYAAKNWGVAVRTTDSYIKAANDEIEAEAKEYRSNAMGRHLQQRRLLMNQALEKGKMGLAFEMMRDEAKLLGLYPVDKLEHSIEVKESPLDKLSSRIASIAATETTRNDIERHH